MSLLSHPRQQSTALLRLSFLRRACHGRGCVQRGIDAEDGEFNLGHVQPAPMLWRVVDLQSVRDPFGLGWVEGCIERGRGMGVEVIEHEDDPFRVGILDVDQVLDAGRPVASRPARSCRDMAPALQRFVPEEEVCRPTPFILVVLPSWMAIASSHWLARVGQELNRQLIEADDGTSGIVGTGVDREDIFGPPTELGVLLRRNAPLFLQMRGQSVFLSVRRTVSYETSAPPSCLPNSAASNRKVHRSCPSGGFRQARAVRGASFSPSIVPGDVRCRRSSSAAPMPSRAARWRNRAMVGTLTSNAFAITVSVHPGPSSLWSVTNRMRARVDRRFGA